MISVNIRVSETRPCEQLDSWMVAQQLGTADSCTGQSDQGWMVEHFTTMGLGHTAKHPYTLSLGIFQEIPAQQTTCVSKGTTLMRPLHTCLIMDSYHGGEIDETSLVKTDLCSVGGMEQQSALMRWHWFLLCEGWGRRHFLWTLHHL